MKSELTESTLPEFRERFGNAHDGVIHRIEYDIFSQSLLPTLFRATIGVKDTQAMSDDKWVNLIIEIENVSNLIIRKPENFSVSIVFRLGIGFFNNTLQVNFLSSSVEENLEYTKVKDKDFPCLVVVGKKCFWHTEPYKARESN